MLWEPMIRRCNLLIGEQQHTYELATFTTADHMFGHFSKGQERSFDIDLHDRIKRFHCGC